MSSGPACWCGEHRKRLSVRRWVVTQRYCNHSAFSGYQHTPSDWSAVRCLECHATWRTKAPYVVRLRDATDADLGIPRA